MEALLILRQSWRSLAKRPGFTAVVVLTLGLGIASTSAIFSVVHAALFKHMPYPDADRLHVVWEDATHYGFPLNSPAPANFLDWKAQSSTLGPMAAISGTTLALTGVDEPELLDAVECTAGFFAVLGARPLLGRAFIEGEDVAGAPRVALVSDGLWRRRFGGDPGVLGRAVRLDGKPVTIVGVMPPTFDFPTRKTDVWVPFSWTDEDRANRGDHYLTVVARLRDDASLESARAEMKTIAARLETAFPDTNAKLGATVVSLREHLSGNVRAPLLALLAAVAFVLLIAWGNVVNLFLVRLASRRGEIAVRIALGASASDLRRLLFAEAALVSILGGGVGLALAAAGVGALRPFLPPSIADVTVVTVGWPVVAFAAAVVGVATVVLGLVPVGQAGSAETVTALREGGRGIARGSHRVQRALVVGEMALSLCLLVAASLMTRTLWALLDVPLGFDPARALLVETVPSDPRYRDLAARTAFYRDVLARVRALPGVEAAGYASHVPLTWTGDNNTVVVEGRPVPPPGQENIVSTRVVTPGYFRAIGSQVVRGRDLAETDVPESSGVIVVNERLARSLWPGEDAVGKRLHRGTPEGQMRWLTVVGVVADVRQWGVDMDPKPEIYLPQAQFKGFYFVPKDLVVRSTIDPASLAASVRREVRAVDKDQPISSLRPLSAVVGVSLAERRLHFSLFLGFAAVAWVLAVVGIYGVLAYGVTQRTREFGVRMALGARASTVWRLVVNEGAQLALLGILLGMGGALLLTRFLSSLLFGVTPNDPLTFVVASLVVLTSALLACLVPARRASRVDPMTALRCE